MWFLFFAASPLPLWQDQEDASTEPVTPSSDASVSTLETSASHRKSRRGGTTGSVGRLRALRAQQQRRQAGEGAGEGKEDGGPRTLPHSSRPMSPLQSPSRPVSSEPPTASTASVSAACGWAMERARDKVALRRRYAANQKGFIQRTRRNASAAGRGYSLGSGASVAPVDGPGAVGILRPHSPLVRPNPAPTAEGTPHPGVPTPPESAQGGAATLPMESPATMRRKRAEAAARRLQG